MRRVSAWFLAGGLVTFAATSVLSISLATIALAVALAGALGLLLQREPWPVDRNVAMAVGIYLALKLITVLTAVDVRHSLREFFEYWPYLVFLAIPFTVKAGPRRVALLRILAVSVAVASVYAVVQHFVGVDYLRDRMLGNPHGRYRATSFFFHHLTWGGYALFASLFFAGQCPRGKRDRILFRVTAVLALLGILATYARGPVAGLVFGLVVYLFVRRSAWKIAGAAVAVTALALIFTPGLFDRFQSAAAIDLNPNAAESRTGIWLSAWAIGEAHPLTGVGPGNFAAAFEQFKVNPHLLPVGHAHNQWLDEWATSGVLGFMGFNILFGTVALALWRRRRQADGLPAAALAAWCGLAAAALFECHFSDAEVLMLALFGAGLGLLPGSKTAEEENGD